MLELVVKVININLPANHPILERCRPLYEYSWFIQSIKDHLQEGMDRDEAIKRAMADCQKEDILEVRGEEKFAEGVEQGKNLNLIGQTRKKIAR